MIRECASRSDACGAVSALRPLLDWLVETGVPLASLLSRAGISERDLDDDRRRLPKARFEAFWRVAIEACDDPALALRVATRAKPNALGVLGYLASASESRRNAFELVQGFTPLLWEDFECALEPRGTVSLLRFGASDHPPPGRLTTEFAVGLTVAMSRALGSGRSDPLEVRFSRPAPAYEDEVRSILQLPVRFAAPEDAVLFPAAMLERTIPSSDADLRRLLERHAAEALARLASGPSLVRRVQAAIVSRLSAGTLSADAVAEQLSMSPRTLRRRLKEEGTTYQTLLDELRVTRARRSLASEHREIEDVARSLGFSDPSAFTKAFRRWTGQTPAEFARSTNGAPATACRRR